jgi:hypothetical protein
MLFLPSRRGAPPIITQVRDPDARSFIQRVQAADGAPLETAVMTALDRFVIGCKADGIWGAIKACCIMAGARTLAGALTPLVGPAPTNVNFVSGDYSRTLGLLGNGTTKSLNTNRDNTADPQDNKHAAARLSVVGAGVLAPILSVETSSAAAYTNSGAFCIVNDTTGDRVVSRHNWGGSGNTSTTALSPGFVGINRSASSGWTLRRPSGETTITATSQTPRAGTINIFSLGATATTAFSSHRIQFYSIGESLGLSLLEARVTTLMADIAAALP